MYLTEDEARKWRCVGPANCGRYGLPPEGTAPNKMVEHVRLCVGSACAMAWRWAPRVKNQTRKYTVAAADIDDYIARNAGGVTVDRTEVAAILRGPNPDMKPQEEWVGYCGLAGAPQQ